MIKLIPLSRAAAPAAAVLGACLLAVCCPASTLAAGTNTPAGTTTAASTTARAAAASGENTPLNIPTTSAGSHTSSGGASIVRTIVGLAIVIAVIWGLSWILRQVKSGREPQVTSEGLASIAALTLGSGRSVHLVRAGSDYVLLGSAEQGIVPIHRYTEQQAREAGLIVEHAIDPPARPGTGLVLGGGNHDGRRAGAPAALVERVRELTVRR